MDQTFFSTQTNVATIHEFRTFFSFVFVQQRAFATFKTFLFIEEVHGSKCHINFSSVLSAFRKLTIREQSFQKRSLDWISLKHVTCYIFDDHTRPLIYLV